MKKYLFFVAVVLSFLACKENTKPAHSTPIEATPLQVFSFSSFTSGNSHLSRLFATDNTLYLSWVETREDSSHLFISQFNATKWTPPERIISGTDWFVNWADFPALAVNNQGDIVTSFLQKSDTATYAYDVKLNFYDAETKHWKKNFILHDDGTKTEHGFISMTTDKNGDFYLSWLDGRNTGNMGGGHDHHGHHGAMTLRTAKVTSAGEIIDDIQLDEKVCDCCQTSITMSQNGPVVAYRDRSDEEIRDISVISFENGSWSSPKTIGEDNWEIAGCPVNGPAIGAYNNSIAVAWFTGANDEGKVQVCFLENEKVIRLDHGNATGRVAIEMISEDIAAVLWMEPHGEEELIQLALVSNLGAIEEQVTISKTTAERASGFPQLQQFESDLYITWTEVEDKTSQVRMATVSISNYLE